MAVTAPEFIRPDGQLDESWLTDLEDIIDSLIPQAEALTDDERAQRAWVYSRVYRMIADDMMARPLSEQSDDVKEVRSLGQIRYWERLANQYQKEYQTLVGRVVSRDTQVIPTW